jgi:hypothetical protein
VGEISRLRLGIGADELEPEQDRGVGAEELAALLPSPPPAGEKKKRPAGKGGRATRSRR